MGFSSIISMMSPKSKLFDQDAQLFFNAQTGAGVTLTTTQMNAVNQLVLDLKSANIWNKMKAVYPMVGGTSAGCKWNLVNPLDTNAAYRLTFTGGVTFSSTGMLGSGVNGYANTFLNPATIFPSGFASIGFYNRKPTTNAGGVYMGTTVGSTNFFRIGLSTVNNIRHFNRGAATGQTNHIVSDELGFSANSRISNTLMTSIDNTGAFLTNTVNITIAYSSFEIPLLALNSSGAMGGYSNAEFSFAYISDALTSSELTSLKSINQTFQTTLGRQV